MSETYRWLDTAYPVRSRGRGSTVRGQIGRIVTLPRPGVIANVLCDFGGRLVVCPAGTLMREADCGGREGA